MKVIASDADINTLGGTLNNGWYLISPNVTITHACMFIVQGNVNLILGKNSSLTVSGVANSTGINVSDANRLSIYAQSTDTNGMGKLVANSADYGAGIGGDVYGNGGAVYNATIRISNKTNIYKRQQIILFFYPGY